MTRILFTAATLIGAAAVLWMASTFVGSNGLALAVTLVIGAAFALGIYELLQFRYATATLGRALDQLGEEAEPDPKHWCALLHPSLQHPTLLRIKGEPVALPGPVFTPYLVGLLVMLGLLGTFIGMVDTLQGTVAALGGSADLEAIRQGLTAPIAGLGVAFGTSVAGIAASAMLGLNSTLARRERMLASRHLDTCINEVFREHTLAHNRQQTYHALQQQAQVLPAIADRLGGLADSLEQMGERLARELSANQAGFHSEVQSRYDALAKSVESSLKESLTASVQLAGESIRPQLEDTLATLNRLTEATQERLTAVADQQLREITTHLREASADMGNAVAAGDAERLARWTDALEQSQQQSSGALSEASAAFSRELQTLREQEQQRADAALQRLAGLEAAAATHLQQLGQGLEAPMTRLIETASETPKAAAEVIGKLREEISSNIARDNSLLEERRQVMEDLHTLSASLQQASGEQRQAVEQLVASSAGVLDEVGGQFNEHVAAQAATLKDISANFSGSASEIAGLGERFAGAVQLFNESNGQLMEKLGQIQAAMGESTARSDEQMGYYVAQAREIIDQSMLGQREIIDELRQLGRTEDLFEAEAS